MAKLAANLIHTHAPRVIDTMLSLRAHKATKFISPNLIVRVVTPLEGNKVPTRIKTMVLSIGTPNFLERKFIKLCLKAKEPFPVKKIQVKMAPVRRTKKKK